MKLEKRMANANSIGMDTIKASLSEADMDKLWFMLENPYSDPIGSIIREYTSNGWDAHVEAGVDSPVVVGSYQEDDDSMHVFFKDSGVGMSLETIKNVFSKYTKSTKNLTDTQLGAWGIGSKSGLSYNDVVQFETTHKGITTLFLLRKGNTQPELDILYSENMGKSDGTIVDIKLKINSDIYEFVEKAYDQLLFFENVYFEGKFIPLNDCTIRKFKTFYSSDSLPDSMKPCVLIGPVMYPINTRMLPENTVKKLEKFNNTPIAFMFDISELDVVQTREQLRYSQKTVESIDAGIDRTTKELQDFVDENTIENLDFEELDKKAFVRKYYNSEPGKFWYLKNKIIESNHPYYLLLSSINAHIVNVDESKIKLLGSPWPKNLYLTNLLNFYRNLVKVKYVKSKYLSLKESTTNGDTLFAGGKVGYKSDKCSYRAFVGPTEYFQWIRLHGNYTKADMSFNQEQHRAYIMPATLSMLAENVKSHNFKFPGVAYKLHKHLTDNFETLFPRSILTIREARLAELRENRGGPTEKAKQEDGFIYLTRLQGSKLSNKPMGVWKSECYKVEEEIEARGIHLLEVPKDFTWCNKVNDFNLFYEDRVVIRMFGKHVMFINANRNSKKYLKSYENYYSFKDFMMNKAKFTIVEAFAIEMSRHKGYNVSELRKIFLCSWVPEEYWTASVTDTLTRLDSGNWIDAIILEAYDTREDIPKALKRRAKMMIHDLEYLQITRVLSENNNYVRHAIDYNNSHRFCFDNGTSKLTHSGINIRRMVDVFMSIMFSFYLAHNRLPVLYKPIFKTWIYDEFVRRGWMGKLCKSK